MGTPDFAVPTLDALVEAGHEILAVVAQPDRPKGRGKKLASPPTIERARELGLPTRQPRALRRGPFPEWFEAAGADVAVVVAYGRILPPRLLAAPRRGCINAHASLLPKYRGAAPIQWAVINGDAETGVTTLFMSEGLDEGDVLLVRRTAIGPDETSGELAARLARLGAELLVETLDRLDQIEPQPQDASQATLAPLLHKADGRIDWSSSAGRVHDRVRGVNPWPGAVTTFRGDTLKVWRTRHAPALPDSAAPHAAPGTVVAVGPRPVVACGTGAVELVEVQLPGRRRQPAEAFANGARLEVGERLGQPAPAS